VTDVGADLEDGGVRITAQAESDVSGEVEAAMEKADLFERTFGLRVAIEAAQGVRA